MTALTTPAPTPVATPRPRTRARPALMIGGLLVLIVVVAATALTLGEVPTSLSDVAITLFGGGTAQHELVILGLRLPRIVTGIAVGAGLGASGAIFQSLTRNPLGSPDIVGFTAGSATGAVLAIVVFGGGTLAIAGGALVGGLACALLVLALASSGGTTTGYRFVLIGIGMAAVLTATNGYLITRASLGDATTAQAWIVGSLNARGWETAIPLLCALVVLIPAALMGRRPLGLLELGDEAAGALGVRVTRARVWLVVCGIALAAAATAAAGPIGFVALAAPQLARRLLRISHAGIGSAALVGALLTMTSDVVAQRALAPITLPVGVVTGFIGGVYLAWLLWSGRSRWSRR